MLRIAGVTGATLLRVALLDGHPFMRLGLKEYLNADRIRVVTESGDGDEALRLVKEARPVLVVLALNLTGGMDAVEVCRRIKRLPDAPYVLVHTAYNFTEDVSACLLAGADSFLHKSTGCEDLLDAVRRTAAGEQIWNLGGRVGERPYIRTILERASLTPREQEVFSLLIHRRTNDEIVDRLCISRQTTKNHVSSVLRKLGFKGRKELYRYLEESN